MRRLLGGSLAAAATLLLLGLFTGTAHAAVPHCYKTTALCAEPVDSIGYHGSYTGHDEPSLLFYSNTRARGTRTCTSLQVPSDPKVMPNQAGTARHLELPAPSGLLARHGAVRQPVRAGVHACRVHAEQRHQHLRRDERRGTRLHRAPPGHRVPRGAVLPTRLGTLASGRQLRRDQVVCGDGDLQPAAEPEHRTLNNIDCRRRAGDEPANFAFITKSGVRTRRRHRSARPTGRSRPSAATDLFMGSGDQLTVDLHNGAAGLVVTIND